VGFRVLYQENEHQNGQFDAIDGLQFKIHFVEQIRMELLVKSFPGDARNLRLKVDLALVIATDVIFRVSREYNREIHQSQRTDCLGGVRPWVPHVHIFFDDFVAIHTC